MDSKERCQEQQQEDRSSPERENPLCKSPSSLPIPSSPLNNSTTILLVLCLINIVVYIKLLAQLLSTSSNQFDLYWLFTLLIGIALELIGLVLVLCDHQNGDALLLAVYGASIVVALTSIYYLVLVREYSLLVLIVVVVNVFTVWRFGYLLAQRWKSQFDDEEEEDEGGEADQQNHNV